MKAKLVKMMLFVLAFCGCIYCNNASSEAASVPKMANKKVTVLTGRTKIVKLKRVKPSMKVTWKSKNKKIAKVYSGGKVRGVRKGKTRIYATVKSNTMRKRLVCYITVRKGANSLTILQGGERITKATINVNKTLQLKYKLLPSTSNDVVTWTSFNSKIAKVSKKGLVKGIKAGTVNVRAKTLSGQTASVKVTVKAVGGWNYSVPKITVVPVPKKPAVNTAYTDTISPSSTYDLTDALGATPLKDVYKKYFKIGAAINGNEVQYTTAASPEMRAVMSRHFNSTTMSNMMKPVFLLDQKACKAMSAKGIEDIPQVDFSDIVDNMEFCKSHGISVRGHVLVWHNQTPNWFFREGYSSQGSLVDADTMRKRMGSYISQVLRFCQTYYPGVIYAWDVVNEAIMEDGSYRNFGNPWYTTIGTSYIEDAFTYARIYADKDVKLFYNDYNSFVPAKTKKIASIAKDLKAKGFLDGVGMQAYINPTYPGISSGEDNIKDALTTFAKAGLEIQLTELTIRVPDVNNISAQDYLNQAAKYKSLMKLLVSMDQDNGGIANISSVTFFGLMDGHYTVFGQPLKNPGQDDYTRLFDKFFGLKPAFNSVLTALD